MEMCRGIIYDTPMWALDVLWYVCVVGWCHAGWFCVDAFARDRATAARPVDAGRRSTALVRAGADADAFVVVVRASSRAPRSREREAACAARTRRCAT